MRVDLLQQAGFKGRGRTFNRKIGDVVQLVNFQPSNYSDDVYINVALWPSVLGHPTEMKENKFPIRGRVEDFVGELNEDKLENLIEILNGPLSNLSSIKSMWLRGYLRNVLIDKEVRYLIDR